MPPVTPCGRIDDDLNDLYTHPLEDVFIVKDENHLNLVHALLVGPKDTPYDGGFFYFLFIYPETYPLRPPTVRFVTARKCRIRLHPQLGNRGQVHLPVLATEGQLRWSCEMSTKNVLIAITSLMMDASPFFSEPAYHKMRGTREGEADSQRYNALIRYEKLNVTVLQMLQPCEEDNFTIPSVLKELIIQIFCENHDRYGKMAEAMALEAYATRKSNTGPLVAGFCEESPPHFTEDDCVILKRQLSTMYKELQRGKRGIYARQLYRSMCEPYMARTSTSEPEVVDIVSSSDEETAAIDAEDEVQVVQVIHASSTH